MEVEEIPEELGITGFPTMLLYVSGNKQNPFMYDEERKPEDWKKFL